jgi:enediyne biosynthesis protein E4
VGRGNNASALGTTVELRVGGDVYRRSHFVSGQAHMPASPLLHFGLGGANVVDEVRVTWPNGEAREDSDWVANDTVTAIQPE